jgi:hypothetical protein
MDHSNIFIMVLLFQVLIQIMPMKRYNLRKKVTELELLLNSHGIFCQPIIWINMKKYKISSVI